MLKHFFTFLWAAARSAAVWTAIFTGVLTVFTYMLFRVSNTTSEIQRTSQRAFLTFAAPQLGPRIVNDAFTPNTAIWTAQEIELVWSNNGETPARDAVVRTNANAFYPDIPEEFDFPLGKKVHVVVGPKSVYGTNLQVPRQVISDAVHNEKRIFIWGDVLYKDAFPKSPERLTEFCVELTHLTIGMMQQTAKTPSNGNAVTRSQPSGPSVIDIDSPSAALVGFQWRQCPAHNCYDEDCKDYDARVTDIKN
jgi:hypothetical protein